jgi:DNA-binding response OmpR family regulator
MGKKILIIDDEQDLVKGLQIILKAKGFKVLAAFDGVIGVQIAHKERPDLIVLDVMMPGMNGYKVCENLKQSSETWDIPIIFLTAKDQIQDEKLAYDKGATYYIKKPFESKELINKIEEILSPNIAQES